MGWYLFGRGKIDSFLSLVIGVYNCGGAVLLCIKETRGYSLLTDVKLWCKCGYETIDCIRK